MLDEGANGRNTFQLADELDFLGARLSTGASWENFTISLSGPKRTFDQAIAAIQVIFVAVQEAERYASMTGIQKKRYAIALVYAALDDLGFAQKTGLLVAIIDSVINGTVESAVPWTIRMETGRDGRQSPIQAVPDTTTAAAIRSASVHASRPAITAPIEKPATKTRFRSTG